MIDDLSDLYARCRSSGFDHEGAMDFLETQLAAELRAAVDTIVKGLAGPSDD